MTDHFTTKKAPAREALQPRPPFQASMGDFPCDASSPFRPGGPHPQSRHA